jgi:hypothetical protein
VGQDPAQQGWASARPPAQHASLPAGATSGLSTNPSALPCRAGLLLSQRLAWPLTAIWFVIKFLTVSGGAGGG